MDDRIKDRPLILICGPTGVGKSELAVKLAKKIGGEIISADSVQVYRGLDIGSAKVSKAEMEGIPHYLIDILNPDEDYGVNLFQQYAVDAINSIYSRGHIPIVVGGTAFYIQALIYGIDFTEEEDDNHEFRNRLISEVSGEADAIALWKRLKEADPQYAEKTHYNNVKRVARALEYINNTGRKFSDYNNEQSERESEFSFKYFALTDDRDVLYERINRRVDNMIKDGLVDEVKGLLDAGYGVNLNSMKSIGYKEICQYLNGRCSYENAIDMIKQNSRHYAKRQLTWLRREKDVIYIDRSKMTDGESVLDEAIRLGDLWKYTENWE